MQHKVSNILSTIFLLLFCVSIAQAQTQQQTLNQYVADLQKNPNDYALREKIIKHVQTMRSAPAIPEGAREHFVMATAIRGGAKDVKGYGLAIKEFRDALLIAPWWPDALRELAIVQKLAGSYDDAIQNLTLYILTNPPDARNAQDEIYKIKAAKKLAQQENQEKAAEEVRKQTSSDYLSGRWKFQGGNEFDRASHAEFHLEGETLVQEMVFDRDCEIGRAGDRREMARLGKAGDKVFKTRNEVMGTDITMEFNGNTIIVTFVESGRKSYYKKQ